jgi:hypothetical protein
MKFQLSFIDVYITKENALNFFKSPIPLYNRFIALSEKVTPHKSIIRTSNSEKLEIKLDKTFIVSSLTSS